MEKFSYHIGSGSYDSTRNVFAESLEEAEAFMQAWYPKDRGWSFELSEQPLDGPCLATNLNALCWHVKEQWERAAELEKQARAIRAELKGADKAIFSALPEEYGNGQREYFLQANALWKIDWEHGEAHIVQDQIV